MQRTIQSPLSDIILGTIMIIEPNISQKNIELLRFILNDRILGKIDSNECFKKASNFLINLQPIEKMELILKVPEEPIPSTLENKDDYYDFNRKKTRSWSTYEDHRLIAGVHRYGFDNWAMVSMFVGNGRTRAQCAQRWNRGLDPKISKDHWTQEEEEKLIKFIMSDGAKGWTQVANGMKNRSDVQCRYHYIQMKKEGRLPENIDETVLLPSAKSLKQLSHNKNTPNNNLVQKNSSDDFNLTDSPNFQKEIPQKLFQNFNLDESNVKNKENNNLFLLDYENKKFESEEQNLKLSFNEKHNSQNEDFKLFLPQFDPKLFIIW